MDWYFRARWLSASLTILLLTVSVRADAEPIRTLKQEGSVDVVAFAPDGKTLAVGCRDGEISLWQLAGNPDPRRLEIPRGRFLSLAFSPDSRFLASASTDGSVRLWDVPTGALVRDLRKRRAMLRPVAFSPDGKALAAGSSRGNIYLWDPVTGAELRQLPVNARSPRSMAFAPDGKTLAIGHTAWSSLNGVAVPPGLPLLDALTGEQVRPFEGQATNVLFSADGRTLAGFPDDDTLRLWEVASGRERGRIPGKFASVALSPDNRLVAAVDTEEGIIRLWDLATLQEVQHLDGHDSDIASLAFSPDGRTLASGGGDFAVLLWDLTPAQKKIAGWSVRLQRKELEDRWEQLAMEDAAKANTAAGSLILAADTSVPFLREQLRRPLVDPQRVARWIGELDDDQFAKRQQAADELETLGYLAEPALRRVMAGKPPLEVYRRVETLLTKLEKGTLSREQLRIIRAVELLERTATKEARQLLDELARQTPPTHATEEARAAVQRLARKP